MIFFFSRMWKKHVNIVISTLLCKLPEVMQATFQFLSHHYSLYLAIHAQTFVDLEICCWFYINLHWEADFLCAGSGQGELSIICLGVTVWPGGHCITCLDDCLLHQNPFVICKGIGCFWSVSIHALLRYFTLAIFNHIWPCAGFLDDPNESDMLNWITVPCPRGMSVETEKNLWWMKMTWDILDLCCVLMSLGWRKWSNEIIKQSNLMSVVVLWK